MNIYSVQSPIFNNFQSKAFHKVPNEQQNLSIDIIKKFCETFKLPNDKINYCQFDEELAVKISTNKELAIKPIVDLLKNANTEKDITAGLLLLNRIYDAGTTKDWSIYPDISKFNYSKSPNVQVMLAGIYRKLLVPDAFGPLSVMFLDNAKQKITTPFDPNEEIGGAILEYLRNQSAEAIYKN